MVGYTLFLLIVPVSTSSTRPYFWLPAPTSNYHFHCLFDLFDSFTGMMTENLIQFFFMPLIKL